jgi:hypothetical protein
MRCVRTFKWGIGALVLCAGLAALKSGVAQETADDTKARDEARRTAEEERWERDSKREREREERGQRGRGREVGGGGYGRGEGGYGGFGGGYGEGYGSGFGVPGRGPKPKEMLGRASFEADPLQNVTKTIVMMQAQPETMNRIREAAKELVDAEDDDAREDAERNLNEQLDKYFEEDMKRREEELAKVERRVKELRELLERRREKKGDIIRLQAEVLRNEADGLGFFSAEGPGGAQNATRWIWQSGAGAGLPQGHPPVPPFPAAPYGPAVPAAPITAPAAVPAAPVAAPAIVPAPEAAPGKR